MITREQAEKMTYEEATLCEDMSVEDHETAEILVQKALFYLARKEEIDMSVDNNGKFLFRLKEKDEGERS